MATQVFTDSELALSGNFTYTLSMEVIDNYNVETNKTLISVRLLLSANINFIETDYVFENIPAYISCDIYDYSDGSEDKKQLYFYEEEKPITCKDNNNENEIYSYSVEIPNRPDGKLVLGISSYIEFFESPSNMLPAAPLQAYKNEMDLSQQFGLCRIYNGSKFDNYFVYIYNGSKFEKYIPYIHNGTNWEIYK